MPDTVSALGSALKSYLAKDWGPFKEQRTWKRLQGMLSRSNIGIQDMRHEKNHEEIRLCSSKIRVLAAVADPAKKVSAEGVHQMMVRMRAIHG